MLGSALVIGREVCYERNGWPQATDGCVTWSLEGRRRMFEILAIPGWKTAGTPLSDWVAQFAGQGFEAVVTRESTAVSWIVVDALRLRGYAVMAGRTVEAINFELSDPDPQSARDALERASIALAWELDDSQDDDDDDD